MKTQVRSLSPLLGGHALLLVMIFLTATTLILAAALNWSRSNTTLNERNNQYFRSLAAAEAATEKVISRLNSDYQTDGELLVFANMGSYRTQIPLSSEDPTWGGYGFADASGAPNLTTVELSAATTFRDLSSQYKGLRGYATGIRIASRARELSRSINVSGGIQQDLDLAAIPIFQFAIFYNVDLEINPGPVMNVTGPVHCNANIYTRPGNTLTFHSDVTAAGEIYHNRKPGDPLAPGGGTIRYLAEHDSGVSSLRLPIGTNNSPATVRQIVEQPPMGELVTSAMGKQRFFNKADVIIVVHNNTIFGRTTEISGTPITIPPEELAKFVKTNITFPDYRERKTVRLTQIDVGSLRQWNATNTITRTRLPYRDIRILYVDDLRSQITNSTPYASTLPAVRLINGQTVLPQGFTVATPKPLYVKGHYNAPANLGTLNTSATLPAALIGDSITVLSGSWNDTYTPNTGLANRDATATTVNAAFLAGIVQTIPSYYSGGVENFPRFLEDWSNITFTYNGSMVVMYDSQIARTIWRAPGEYYNPPNRNWAFDQNFRELAKLPPGTPAMRVLIRGQWARL